MTTQSEQLLENNLMHQLTTLGYEQVAIPTEADLYSNLKEQLQIHNKLTFSENEFTKVLNHLNKGSIFEKAKTLRDKFQLTKDDGTTAYIEFINQDEWCQNQYQVTNQVTIKGKYENRYDVTILINGLPLVQIELKKRGLEIKEAFNQISRYQEHSFGAGMALFQYVQLFVISNGVNTKYFANNRNTSFKQTFYWSDDRNNRIASLSDFADAFLEKCKLSKMLTKYIVLHQTDKILMALRPYQFYAVEAIIDKVKNSTSNGYIWHTTGSGKTLTSFKASQIITQLPHIDKVVFVVDRNDLDYQTMKEFNNFKQGSVDSTSNTKVLVDQFTDPNTSLIVTTIQKLNTAISKSKYLAQMDAYKDKNVVFIFDECHRSQFGETHKKITQFFTQHQLFGFTGTPILAKNAASTDEGKKTTKDLFYECLHKYVITDAIRDENVLKFAIEYVGRYQKKDSANEIDIEVEAIDTKELLESDIRIEKIANYIINNHARKTHNKTFTGMFCVSSTDVLVKYYKAFKTLKAEGKHDLKIATIFSYAANEERDSDNGHIEDSHLDENAAISPLKRDLLESYINDYNQEFGCNYSTKDSKSFYNYYKDIAQRVKRKEIDILLVVNMFLTGFDSKSLNTLYVDKNLKYHGLIQAYSRTNRILNDKKSQGNIIAFRNLKNNTDDAIGLFSDKNASEDIIIPAYESQLERLNQAYEKLIALTPSPDSVNDLYNEEEELEFIKQFRELMRALNVLESFADFTFDDIALNAQEFNDFKSKYLDLHQKVKTNKQKEKVSILDEVDFELELIHRDEINVRYILQLLVKANKSSDKKEATQIKNQVIDLLSGQSQLRSKKELIEQFIEENLPKISNSDSIESEFTNYINQQKERASKELCDTENLIPEKLDAIVSDYLFTGREPLRDTIINALKEKPSILQRKKTGERILIKIKEFVETYINTDN